MSSMKVLVWISLILLLITGVLGTSPNTASSLVLEQEISSGIELFPSSVYALDSASVELYLFAQESNRQSILSEEFGQNFIGQDNNKLRFAWSKTDQTRLEVITLQRVRTEAKRDYVFEKIPFPLDPLEPDIARYVAFTEKIDRSPEIAALAQQLAAGENDLFKLQTKIAAWIVDNIEYNLSTITAEANQPSSLVIAQGYGVCNEITNLFLSINRELGIPARFVSGMAYSDSLLFDSPWGNHGWAEVYFPGVGWVPFDVTYRQFGWIDPSHIALSKEVDGATPALKSQTIGYGYEFSTLPLSFETYILDEVQQSTSPVNIELEPVFDEVGIGSFAAVQVTVYNPNQFYVSERVQVIPTSNLELLDESYHYIALAPGEEISFPLRIQVDQNLDAGFLYTFPVVLYDSFQNEYRTSFSVGPSFPFVDVQSLPTLTKDTKSFGSITCFGPGEVRQEENASITCALAPNATRARQVCLETSCQIVPLNGTVSFPVNTSELGVFTQSLSSGFSEDIIVSYRVADYPNAQITNISLANIDDFNIPIHLSFLASRTSHTIPRNVVIEISHELFTQTYNLEALHHTQPIGIAIPSELFTLQENTIEITLSSDDIVLTSENITFTNVPSTFTSYFYGGMNSVNSILARQGITSPELRSLITLFSVSLTVLVLLRLLIKAFSKLRR